MIRWCSFCRRYLGEVEPFDDYSLTHGMCHRCSSAGAFSDPRHVHRIRPIADFYARVADAPLEAGVNAQRLLDEGLALGIAPFDLLIGVIQPALYRMGELWARSEARVAVEHELTAVCETIIELLFARHPEFDRLRQVDAPRVLLVNADDNFHTIGIKIVEFFVVSRGVPVRTLYPGLPTHEVVALARLHAPQIVGISCALPTQIRSVRETAAAIAQLPPESRPEVVVGGFALRGGIGLPPEASARTCTDLDCLCPD